MKRTGLFKDKDNSAETMDEKKDAIADDSMELTDDELEGVAGGRLDSDYNPYGHGRDVKLR